MLLLLLDFVKKCLLDGLSLSDAFTAFAKQNAYTFKSVKKCFYSAVYGLKDHPNLAKRLEVNIEKMLSPSNAFNMAAVNRYIINNGGDVNKCVFELCLGDETEASALLKRYFNFYPDNIKCETIIQKKSVPLAHYALNLQAKYFNSNN